MGMIPQQNKLPGYGPMHSWYLGMQKQRFFSDVDL